MQKNWNSKYFLFIFLVCLYHYSMVAQDVVTLRRTGVYRGKNSYVQNPFHTDSVFCTLAVRINGKEQKIDVNRSAYEIDLSAFRSGDSITIEIIHYKDCIPSLLNSHTGHYSPLVFGEIVVAEERIQWHCLPGTKPGTIEIEHLEYNQWQSKGRVNIDALNSDTLLSFGIQTFSGKNKYRLKYTDTQGRMCYSAVKEYYSDKTPVGIQRKKKK